MGAHHHDPSTPHSRRHPNVVQLQGRTLDGHPRVDGPLRVMAVADRYPPLVNAGGETMLHGLLAPMAAAGHDVTVVTHTPTGPYDLDGVHVVQRPQRKTLGPMAEGMDVIIGHLMWTRAAVDLAAATGAPLLYLAHNHRQLRHWSLMADRDVTVLAVNSEVLAREIQTPRQRGMPDVACRGVDMWGGPSVVIRPPCRTAAYALERDPAHAEFVTLVNPQEAKGSDVFYQLARQAPPRRWLAVEGGYGEQVKPGRHDPAVVWQPQTASMRDDVYARTRVLLMPSDYESWGLAAVEAMASGIPVIAHPTSGLRESLAGAATFIDRDDLHAWHDELGRLDDPAYYRARSDAARARSAELDRLAVEDQATFVDVIRAAAHVARVRSAATT